jgi:O-antigen/teichoic acid export membrane protein
MNLLPDRGSRLYKIELASLLVLGSLLNFVFPFLIAKSISVQSFGIFVILWAEITIFSYMLTGVQTHVAIVTTEAIVQRKLEPKGYVYDPFTNQFFRILSLPVILLLILGLMSNTNDTFRNIFFFAALAIPVISITAITLGKLQGNNDPLNYFRIICLIAFTKILWVPIFFTFSISPYSFIYSLMLLQLGLILIIGWSNPVKHAIQIDQLSGVLVKVVTINLVFWAFLNSDTLLVRAHLSLEMSGLYSAASSLSKVPITLTAVLITIFLTRVIELEIHKESSSQLRKFIYSFVVFLHVTFFMLGYFFGPLLIKIFLGEKYSQSYQMFVLLNLITGVFSVLLVFISLNLNKISKRNVYVSVLVLLGHTVLLGTTRVTVEVFIFLFGFFALCMLIANMLIIKFSKSQKKA